MKTIAKDEKVDGLRPEYDLSSPLKEGVRGKYAKRYEQGTTLVLLSPDVARDFPNSDWQFRCAPLPAGYAERWPKNRFDIVYDVD